MSERIEFPDGSIYESEKGLWKKVTDRRGGWMIDKRGPGAGVTYSHSFDELDKNCQAYEFYVGKPFCAIATATLGHQAYHQLDVLRVFQNQVVARIPGGRRLSEHYDHIKGKVAAFINGKPVLKGTFLYPFILPSLWLLRHKNNGCVRNSALNTAVFVIYLLGLAWATLLSRVSKFL